MTTTTGAVVIRKTTEIIQTTLTDAEVARAVRPASMKDYVQARIDGAIETRCGGRRRTRIATRPPTARRGANSRRPRLTSSVLSVRTRRRGPWIPTCASLKSSQDALWPNRGCSQTRPEPRGVAGAARAAVAQESAADVARAATEAEEAVAPRDGEEGLAPRDGPAEAGEAALGRRGRAGAGGGRLGRPGRAVRRRRRRRQRFRRRRRRIHLSTSTSTRSTTAARSSSGAWTCPAPSGSRSAATRSTSTCRSTTCPSRATTRRSASRAA